MGDVRSALHALYHHEDPAIKEQANRWLETWQQTPEAWSVADGILHDSQSSLEEQYFCAQTLRTKVQKDFEELPPAAIESLRDSLLRLLLKYSQGRPPVRTQLCLALAALAVHWPAAHWGEGGVLTWFVNRFGELPQGIGLSCMLELLTVLPQEANSTKIAIRPERQRQFTSELGSSLSSTLGVLVSCLNQPGERIREQVLLAFASWLKLSEGRGLDASALVQHPLVTAALSGLQESSYVFHAAVEAVCELIWVTVDPQSSTLNPAMMPLAQLIVQAVMQLRPRFAVQAHRLAAEQAGVDVKDDVSDRQDDDEDSAKGMARLFVEVGEAYVQLVVTAQTEVFAPVEALLEVSAYPDFNIASMSFIFWHKLARQLSSAFLPRAPGGDNTLEAASNEQQRRREFFLPAFERLVAAIRGRVRFPESYDTWDSTERSDFKRARHDISDTLEDCCNVLGPQRTLNLLVAPLQEASDKARAGGAFDWRPVEAALYCVRAVHQNVPAVGDPSLLGLLSALPSLPKQPAQLQYTACLVIGAYAPWLAASARNSPSAAALLPALLQMLVEALAHAAASASAAMSIRRLCEACGEAFAPYKEQLFALYDRMLSAGAFAAWTGKPAQGLAVAEDDVLMVLEGISTTAQKCSPLDQQQAVLERLTARVLPPIEEAVAVDPAVVIASGQRAPPILALFDRLAVLVRTVQHAELAAALLSRSFPALHTAQARVTSDSKATERICRVLRFGIRSAGTACGPLLPTLTVQLPAQFAASRQPVYLYLLSELVKIFGPSKQYDAQLQPALHGVLRASCSGLSQTEALAADPDLVDDTFLLAARMLHYAPRMVMEPMLLGALLDVATLGLLVQHREACCSVLTFLARLVDPETHRNPGAAPDAAAQLHAAFGPRAPLMVRLLLAGVAGVLPSARLPELSDVLATLVKAAGQQGLAWLAEAAAALPPSAAEDSDRQALLGAAAGLLNGGMASDADAKFDIAVHDLGSLCRRNPRSRQAATRALLPANLHSALVVT